MENPFFTALEMQGAKAAAFDKQTNVQLMPFRHYLENSIKALENKEVSCSWLPVGGQRFRITPQQRIWQLVPYTEIEIINELAGWYQIISVDGEQPDAEFDPDEMDPIIQGKGKSKREHELAECGYKKYPDFRLYLPSMELDEEPVSWSGYQLELRPLDVEIGQLNTIYVDGQPCKVVSQADGRLKIQGYVQASSHLSIDGQDIPFSVAKSFDENSLKSLSIKRNNQGWLVFSLERPAINACQLNDITHKALAELSVSHFSVEDLTLNVDSWVVSTEKNSVVLERINEEQCVAIKKISCLAFPEIQWQVTQIENKEKWIQLFEKIGSDDTGKSDLDYFFDDNQNSKILDATQRKHDEGFRVLKARPEERQILLARNQRGKKNHQSEYPNSNGKNREIRISVDTSQLRRQKEALNQLMCRPAKAHWPLIQLLQERSQTLWPDVTPIPEQGVEWQVLSDPDFDGCNKQREFVSKALASNDFTILDGPPGTGKTTTILELIYQLVTKGKRVLLSASTHAAINNVLERVKESQSLSQVIHPLRVGDESNATGVEEFQFDNLLNQYKSVAGGSSISKQLMVDSSNLVCGTTIGILRLFNDRDIVLDAGEPPFDVMIIDECSKTTFQEFLVPARFAKRWVLVGDIRQLSPFTDREQIVANLDNLMITPARGKSKAQTLSADVQRACFLLEELRGSKETPYSQPMILPLTSGVISAIKQEVTHRKQQKQLSAGLDNILVIPSQRLPNDPQWVKDVQDIKAQPWHFYQFTLCFVDETRLDDIQPLIPQDCIVLHSGWWRTQHASQYYRQGINTKAFKIKNSEITNSLDIQSELLDRFSSSKWSEEVCWRLEREYWLRLSQNQKRKTGYLEETLQRLFPKSIDVDGRIHMVKNIAFPSILEALSGNGLVKRRKDQPTTLNQGFTACEKQQRHTTLTYQHRMHPEIAKFPRTQFYPQGVLVDGKYTTSARDWDYPRYVSRNIWLNVNGQTQKGNSNPQEVEAVMAELKAFCDWAEDNAKNEKNEPYDVAILTFYKGQEKALRDALKKLPGNQSRYARFNYKGIAIKLATVDYFQGQEADVVFLSMVNTHRDGFMDSPNRLNVAITRARYQLVIAGNHDYFSNRSRTEELKNLANSAQALETHNSKNSRHNSNYRGSKVSG